MKFAEALYPERVAEISDARVIGIDIGSRSAKGVLLADGEVYTALVPTGLYMLSTPI